VIHSYIAGSISDEALLHSNLVQVVNTCTSVTKQYNLVLVKGWWCAKAGKVIAGLA